MRITVLLFSLILSATTYAFTFITVPELVEGISIKKHGFNVEIGTPENCNEKYPLRANKGFNENKGLLENADLKSPPKGYREIFIAIPEMIGESRLHYIDLMYIRGRSSLLGTELMPRVYDRKRRKAHGVKLCTLLKNLKHFRLIVSYHQYFPSEGRSYNTQIFHLEGLEKFIQK